MTSYLRRKRVPTRDTDLGPPNRRWQNKTLARAIAVALLAGGALPATSFAGSISGYKFFDNFDTGNDVVANGVRDDQDVLLENHMILLKKNGRKLTQQLTNDNGYYSFPNLSDGKYQLSINIPRGACSTAPKPDDNTAHSRNINYDVTIKHSQNRQVDIGIATSCVQPITPGNACGDDPSISVPSVISQGDGEWDNSTTWSTGRVPNAGDSVKVDNGHVVTMPPEMVNLGTGSFCNEGSITSSENTREFGASDIEIHASVINNRGKITGKDGIDGSCFVRGVSASNIMLFASSVFVNESTINSEALISTGNGGTSYGGNSWRFEGLFRLLSGSVCPNHRNVYAGHGGGIEIKAGIIENHSNVVAGNGGNAGISHHAYAYAGEGGYIVVSSDNVNDSVNTAVIATGHGGWSSGYKTGTRHSSGGNVIVNLGDLNGEIVGAPGSVMYGDPINLRLGENLKIRDFESVNLYTDEGGTIDFTKVNENTFSNVKVISIATKSLNGEGGSIDLRGISGKIFKAAEKVEIFADNIQLDAGVDINDLIEAPEVVVEKGKLIYHVQLSSDRQIVGEPSSTVTIPINVFNASPKDDSYTFTVTDSEGWTLGTIAEVVVKGLQQATVKLDVTLPSERAATNEITITATSKTKSDVTSEIKIHAMVNAGEDSDEDGHPDVLDQFPDNADEWLDTDGDGEGDNADTDDDNDGMLDTWENQYEGLVSVINDANDDLDEDGFSNLAESQADTDPTDPDSKPVVEPENVPPTAALAITPESGKAPLTVALDGSSSTDTDGNITSHAWTASNGQTADGQNAELTFNDAGKYTITLKVTDNDGATHSASSQQITVAKQGEYTAHGTLRDELGQPIVGAKVQIGDNTTTTDDAGNWAISGLQEGDDYTVKASKDGYTFAPENLALGNEVFKQNVTFKPVSALSVKVVAKPPVVKQDDNVTYTMTVINGGEETATNVALNSVLPAGTTLVSLEALDGGNCDTDTLSCTLSELATGGSARFKIVINNTQTKALVTQTTVTANEYPADVAKKWTRVIPYLSVSISDTPDPLEMAQAEVDRMLHYTLAVELSENAPSAATGVELVATLPQGVELQSVNSDYGMCDLSESPKLTCSMTDLSVDSADDISKVTLDVDVVLKDPGILVLTHEAKVTANEYPAHTDRERTKVFIPESVQVDIAFVIDDTGSMQGEINGVKKALIAFIEEIDTSEAPLSVLLTFGDEVKYRAVTQDMTVLRDAIGKLKASGGGTCPEASYEAISFAIPHVKKGGTILFATDASPYEGSDVEEMIVRLRNKGIIFNAMIFGDCSDENSWNEQPE